MKKKDFIYLDNSATTKLDPRVSRIIRDKQFNLPLNPSAPHFLGRMGKAILSKSRANIKNCLGVKNGSIIFTSSASEAINMAIKGIYKKRPGHIIASGSEHKATLSTLNYLKTHGADITFINSQHGNLSPEKIKQHLKDNTSIIIAMSANNETGIKNNLVEIGNISKSKNIELIVDATASWGRHPFHIDNSMSAVCISPHKFHGPKGVGICFLKEGLYIDSLIHGGMQEFGLRAGTENISNIYASSIAMEICMNEMDKNIKKIELLNDVFLSYIKKLIPESSINDGMGQDRVKHIINMYLPFVDAQTTTIMLDRKKILVSQGSACSAISQQRSHVLTSMGMDSRADYCIRISTSKYNTIKDLKTAAEQISKIQLMHS